MTPARWLGTTLIPISLLAASAARAQPLGSGNEEGTPFPTDYSTRPVAEPVKPPVAPEPAAPRFGQRGETVLTTASGGANGAGISYLSDSGSLATLFSASFDAGLDYFVVDHLSIGFDLGLGYSNDSVYTANSTLVSTKSTSLEAGVRFGADLPLGDLFSFYPRLTLGIADDHQSSGISGQSPTSETAHVGPWLNLYAPFLLHPAPHFFVGVGPRITHDFANTIGGEPGVSGQATTVQASFVLGGWWGGPTPVPTAGEPPASPGARERRFGDRGTLVITNDTDGYAYSTTYAGSNSSTFGVLVEPGFDYFIADHFSMGLDVWANYGKTKSFDASGNLSVSTSVGLGFAPRLGVEVPIVDALSWYPRASIGFGPESTDETSNGAENQHTISRIFVSAEAPLLVHAARHFFVGAGPTVYRDLSRTDQNNVSNQATQFGASVLIGGWL